MSLAVLRAAAEQAITVYETRNEFVGDLDLPESQKQRLLGDRPEWADFVVSLTSDLPAHLEAETTTEQIRATLGYPAAMRGVAVRILAVADLVEDERVAGFS
jgi:hypothetical protein